jgi:conjugal transfer mating pair stabilization protein TraN
LGHILAALLVWHPLNNTLGDTQRSTGLQGQREGRALVDAASLPTLNNGQLVIPLGSDTLSLDAGELVPGSGATDLSTLQDAYGSDSALQAQGEQAQAALANDETASGDAYRLLRSLQQLARPALDQDPLWSVTDTVQADPNVISQTFPDCVGSPEEPRCVVSGLLPEAFGACDTTRQVTPFTDYKHVPDYRVCEQIQQLTRCGLTREVEIGAFEQHWRVQASGCVEDQVRSFRPAATTLISGNVTLRAPVDPALSLLQLPTRDNGWTTQVQIAGNAQYQLEYQPRTEDPATGEALDCEPGWQVSDDPALCEREVMWCDTPITIDGTLVFSGDSLSQQVLHAPADEGLQRCLMQSDEFTAVQWQCTDQQPRQLQGYTLGAAELGLLASLYPDEVDSPAHLTSTGSSDELGDRCWAATATYNTGSGQAEFHLGTGNPWVDPDGNVQVIENTLDNTTLNRCTALAENPACRPVRSECTEGAMGHEDFCYLHNHIYDCGYPVALDNAAVATHVQCPGPVRCMGTDCLEPETVLQANFAEAAAMLDAAQHLTNDLDCSSAGDCTVFSGEAGECKKAVGGIVDCCEKPTGIGLGEYIRLISAMNRLDTAVMAMDPGTATYGAWNTLRQPVTDTWTALREPFISTWDTLTGAVPDTAASMSAEQAAGGFLQALTNQTAEWVGSTFGPGAQSALFSNAGGAIGADGLVSGGDFALGGSVGTALSTVMTAYMIYTVTMILIQLIWRCEEKEFELNAQRALGACHYVGSYCKSDILGSCIEKRQGYCCFSSPLSRILQEQIRPQLGMGWGRAKSPSCTGVPASQLASVDWSRVSLDEWVGMLAQAGMLPDIALETSPDLPGLEQGWSVPGRVDEAMQRVRERLE